MSIENPRDSDAPGRPGTGIGLQNVKRRLAALHGDAASLRVLPTADAFRVEIRLPAPGTLRPEAPGATAHALAFASGSVLPSTGAMMRSSLISRSNCSG